MIITQIEVSPLDLELQTALNVAYGSYPVLNYALVIIHTEGGLKGFGEASPDPEVTGETQQKVLQVLEKSTSYLIGKNPFDVAGLIRQCQDNMPSFPAAIAAIDMALYDLIGKALHTPLYNILGGKKRTPMRLYPVIPMDSPQVMAEMSQHFVKMGAGILKVKLGSDPDEDLERMLSITSAVGKNIRLRPDINQGWKEVKIAIQTIKRMAGLNIEYIEQPVAANDLDSLARVAAAVDIPIMADESCHSAADVLKIANMHAADMINIKLMKCGGIYQAQKMLAVAEAAGLPCILGSMGESSIGSAAGLHFVAANPGIKDCELIGPLFINNDPAEGYLVDPTTFEAFLLEEPGLGVRLK